MNWEIYDSKDLNASVKKVQSQKTERTPSCFPGHTSLYRPQIVYLFLSADFVMDSEIINEVGMYI